MLIFFVEIVGLSLNVFPVSVFRPSPRKGTKKRNDGGSRTSTIDDGNQRLYPMFPLPSRTFLQCFFFSLQGRLNFNFHCFPFILKISLAFAKRV